MQDITDLPELRSLTVQAYGRTHTLEPHKDLAIQVSTLGEALQEHPSKYAFYASLKDLAQRRVDAVSAELSHARSKVDQKWRSVGFLPDGSKITEDSMRRALRLVPEIHETETKLEEAQHTLRILTTLVRALEIRRDMLVALSTRTNSGNFHDSDIKLPVQIGGKADLSSRLGSPEGQEQIKEKLKSKGVHPSKRS